MTEIKSNTLSDDVMKMLKGKSVDYQIGFNDALIYVNRKIREWQKEKE